VLAHPKTTNVAAAVALAGLGFDRTRSVVVADPRLSANRTILTARGRFGSLRVELDNVPSPNPRTSLLVAYSVLATLRRQRERVTIAS
jgi:aspartate dehydrogenase